MSQANQYCLRCPGGLGFGNHLRVHQVQRHQIFTHTRLICTSPKTTFLLALSVASCILEGSNFCSSEVAKLSRLILLNNIDIYPEVSNSGDNYGWWGLRGAIQLVMHSEVRWRVCEWPPGPRAKGSNRSWEPGLPVLWFTWTLQTWLQGRDIKQHTKLNQHIPEQNCQAGNLLSEQNAPARICCWMQRPMSPLPFLLVHNHTIQTTLLWKLNVSIFPSFLPTWGTWGHVLGQVNHEGVPAPLSTSTGASMNTMRGQVETASVSPHRSLDRGLFASLTLDHPSSVCVFNRLESMFNITAATAIQPLKGSV